MAAGKAAAIGGRYGSSGIAPQRGRRRSADVTAAARRREGGGDRQMLRKQVLPRATWKAAVSRSLIQQRVAHRATVPPGGWR